MSNPENYLKGHDLTGDINVPQLDLLGNYISYTERPASPDSEGIEGRIKTAPDGIFFYADGRWRKTPAYTYNWSELTEDVRFLPLNREIQLSDQEKLYLSQAFGIEKATQSKLGMVKGSSRSQSYGAVQINIDGSQVVPPATTQYSGTVRVTDIDSSGSAPIVATKAYVDSRVTSDGLVIPRATFENIGGVKLGGDIVGMDSQGRISVAKASHTPSHIQSYGLVRIAPPEFTIDAASDAYDDSTQDIPYVVTVSQAKNVATKAMEAYSVPIQDYIATTTVAGFVKPGQGLQIQDDGTLTVNTASISNSGIVMLYDDSEESTSDPTTTLPTMLVVMDYVGALGYITVQEIPKAGTTTIGGIKFNASGPITVDQDTGVIRIDQAGVGTQGTVSIAGSAPYTSNSVLTALATSELIKSSIDGTVVAATESQPGIVKVSIGSNDSDTGPYTVYTVSATQDAINSIYTSSEWKTNVGAAVEDYFQTTPIQALAKFAGGAIFSQEIGADPVIVKFHEVTPLITGTSGDVKEEYLPNDILNYQLILDLLSGGGGEQPLIPWASYNQDENKVTITADQQVDGDLSVLGRVTGNTTFANTVTFSIIKVGGILGNSRSFNIGPLGKTNLLSLSYNSSTGNGLLTIDGNTTIRGPLTIEGNNDFRVGSIRSYDGYSPVRFLSNVSFSFSHSIQDVKRINSELAEISDLNLMPIGSSKAQATILLYGQGIPVIPINPLNYSISVQLYNGDPTAISPGELVLREDFSSYTTNPFESIRVRLLSSSDWNEYFSDVVFQGSYSRMLFVMRSPETKYNTYYIKVTVQGDDIQTYDYSQLVGFSGAYLPSGVVARIHGDATMLGCLSLTQLKATGISDLQYVEFDQDTRLFTYKNTTNVGAPQLRYNEIPGAIEGSKAIPTVTGKKFLVCIASNAGTITASTLKTYLNNRMLYVGTKQPEINCLDVTTRVVIVTFDQEMGTYIKPAEVEGDEDEYWSMDDRIYDAIHKEKSSFLREWLTVIPI